MRLFTVHGWAFKAHDGAAGAAYLWADRLMSPLTTTTICVAESEREAGLRARTCRAARTVVIHNGVELDRPRRASAAAGRPVTSLSVGRLRAPKDFMTLVRAIAGSSPARLRLRIAGDGPERPASPHEIARLGLDERVELLGTARRRRPRCSPRADVFVLSSDSEGMPMSVLEAMAAGLPVVASAVGGVPELVRDGETGALVPPRDPAALGRAIDAPRRATRRCGDRLGDAGRRAGRARVRRSRDFRRAHLELYRAALRR